MSAYRQSLIDTPKLPRRFSIFPAVVVGGCLMVASAANAASASDPTLTLYNGQHQQATHLLVQSFEKKTGIQVKVRNGSGPELASQIIKEGKQSPADVFFTENSPELMRLQGKGLLAKIDPGTLKQVPQRYNSSEGRWIGLLARQNVMVYNPNKIKKSDLPKTLMAATNKVYRGKFAVSAVDGDFLPMVKALVIEKGKSKTLEWLKKLKNTAKQYNKDEGVITAVNNGGAAFGIANNYYYYRAREQIGKSKMTEKIAHFKAGNVGNLVNVSGAAILKSAPHPKLAQKFVKFMASKQAQTILARSDIDFEYPLRPGVSANQQLKPFNKLNPPKIRADNLGDNRLSLKLLRRAGLL